MKFSIMRKLERRPVASAFLRRYIAAGLPVPASVRLQMANEFHAELIARLMGVVVEEGALTREAAYGAARALGAEIAAQAVRLLDVDRDDAASLAGLVDFVHAMLNIRGKTVVAAGPKEAVSHWRDCSLAAQLAETPGGEYYCHLYQEAYKGALAALNPRARANDLAITGSRGCDHCELHTWIEA